MKYNNITRTVSFLSLTLVMSAFLVTPLRAEAAIWKWLLPFPAPLLIKDNNSSAPAPTTPVAVTPLNVSCIASVTSSYVGDSVTWQAYVSGGGNVARTFLWSGSEVSGRTARLFTVQYATPGTKTASVTVRAGNQTKTATCDGSVSVSFLNNNNNGGNDNNNNNNGSLYVTCSADDTSVYIGDRVRWTATVSGGNGSYTYDWTGSEGLGGSSRTSTITYDRTGTKYAEVHVTSGGYSATRRCDDDVYVNDDYNNNGNNNNYYNDYYGYNNNSLDVTCTANMSTARAGENVTWQAYATGGNGYYAYSWSGSEGVTGYDYYTSKTYQTPGPKTASVTVRSNGRTVTRTCAQVVISGNNIIPYIPPVQNGTLDASCAPSVSYAKAGSYVIWNSEATGGNGYYTYSWSGDGISGSGSAVGTTYYGTGSKSATLTISSGGQTISRSCGSVSISARETYRAPIVATSYTPVSGLDGSCFVNASVSKTGRIVEWSALASGGDSTYTYIWNGDEGLTGNGNKAYKSYVMPGSKIGSVTIMSGNQSIVRNCVNSVTITDEEATTNSAASILSINIPLSWLVTLLIAILLGVIGYLIYARKEDTQKRNDSYNGINLPR